MDDPGRLQALERQLRAGWPRLRFEPALEHSFREQYRVWARPFRLTLIGFAMFAIAVTPLLDLWLLHPPADFMGPAHFSQIFVMLPVLVLAWLCTQRERLRRWADASALLAVSVVAGGLLFQRYLGARYQVWVPTELITVTMAGGIVMGGLGFWRTLPLALLLVVAISTCEVLSYGNNATTQYIIFGVVVQFLVIGLAGYLQEHFARDTWLRGQLLEILATQDSLTGLYNFRTFQQRCDQLFRLAARERKPVMVALLDLDHFKQYNDAYGHGAGNDCLRSVAAHLAQHLRRGSDLQARLGGEEFVLAFYDMERAAVAPYLERLRASIEALGIAHERSPLPSRVVTASIGACWCAAGSTPGVDAALHEADRQLYKAKDAGRNCVLLSEGVAAQANSRR